MPLIWTKQLMDRMADRHGSQKMLTWQPFRREISNMEDLSEVST